MNNIYVLNKNYKKIGTLSNQGANPQAPYYEDLYVQELETGADTYQFSTTSSKYTQDILEIGNHIMFAYKNRNELFTITSIEYSHNEGYKTIGVYAEGIGFDLLEIFMKRPEINKEDSGNNGGNDFDNDGDDNTDGEYADPDHFYIDETGVIIWDKDGSGPPSEDDITIDGDGNIIYRPSKNNKKNDSLEFKNISYPRFLSILLKDSGWSYICQPGLESVKHDISVKYDTNIYALLQDSMQSYRGVELEFVHELVGGRVQRVIKAYKDGGRGSFVGKRFEYGKNVRGITKMQEVTDSQDDTILYVDNVGVAVQYDVDFALKSAEVPEIEIGDTHYVIDRDFCPPMQIKARIGKIEISFSDPTKNKIYLANNKRISGSAIEDEFGADDVADMLDDYEFDGDSGAAYDHYHDRLICDYTRVSKDPITGEENGTASYQTSVILDGHGLLPDWHDYYNLGSKDKLWRYIYTSAVDSNNCIMSPRYHGYNYQVYFDRDDMEDVVKITDSSEVTKQDLLNYIMNDLNVYEYSAKKVNEVVNEDVDDPDAYVPNQIYFGLLSEDVYDHGNPCYTSEVGLRLSSALIRNDTNNDGDQNDNDGHNTHTYNIPALLAALIGAFQHYVSGGRVTTSSPSPKDQNAGYGGGKNPDPFDPDNPGTGEGGDNPGTDNPGTGIYVTLAYADEHYASKAAFELTELQCNKNEVDIMELKRIVIGSGSGGDDPSDPGSGSTPGTGNVFDTITVRKIIGPDRGEDQYKLVDFENGIGVSHIYCNSEDENGHIIIGDNVRIEAAMVIDGNILLEEGGYIEFPDGSKLTSANGLGTGGGTISGIPDGTFEYIQTENSAQFFGSEWLNINSNVNLGENNLIISGSLVVFGALEQIDYLHAREADIGTLRVNGTEINPAALAATVSTDLSEYATVEALQEEIRVKDEQIASLEARLAKIEAMLGINN